MSHTTPKSAPAKKAAASPRPRSRAVAAVPTVSVKEIENTPAPLPADPARVHELISETAYRIWESEGRPAGRHVDHWLEAERLVREGLH